MGGLLAIALWAMGLTGFALLAWVGRAGARSSTPRDCERLAPGATRWVPMGWPAGAGEGLADAGVLADGRVAVSMVTTLQPDEPRPCEVWDPATGRWARGVEIVPAAPPPGSRCEAALPGGRRLVLTPDDGGARVTIEPAGRDLPPLPASPDRCGAAEGPDGTLRVVVGDASFRLDAGADAWVATRLPPLREPRHAEVRLVLADGTVIVAGGLLVTTRGRPRPAVIARKLTGVIGAAGLGWLAVRALRGPHPPHAWAIVVGVAVGVVVVVAGGLRLLRALAWH